jgi:hypothetical protein
VWGSEFNTKAATHRGDSGEIATGLKLTDCVMVVPASPLEQLCLIWNSHRENVVVGRVTGRARAMRAIAPSMPPHVCPRQGRRRPTPRGRWIPTPRYCAAGAAPYKRFKHASAVARPQRSYLLATRTRRRYIAKRNKACAGRLLSCIENWSYELN